MSNRYLAALQESYNVLGLTSMVALSAATLNPLPLLVGLVAEAAYLIFVPDSSWYSKHLSRRHDAEIQARRDEIKAKSLPLLRPPLQDRFLRLETVRREIDGQAAGDAIWMREVLRKLDFLLEKFLQFAVKEEQFRAYLQEARSEIEGGPPNGQYAIRGQGGRPDRDSHRDDNRDSRRNASVRNASVLPPSVPQPARATSTDETWLAQTVPIVQSGFDRDISKIEIDYASETDQSTRAILEKRLEVLRRRREFIAKIGKIVANLSHQLALLEDTFGLISDELLARPPEQVLADIDDVVSQTNTMTQVLEELAPYERMLSQVGN
jgi:hypothetical protein